MRAHVMLLEENLSAEVRQGLDDLAKNCSASAYDLRALLSSLRKSDALSAGELPDADSLKRDIADEVLRLWRGGFRVEVM